MKLTLFANRDVEIIQLSLNVDNRFATVVSTFRVLPNSASDKEILREVKSMRRQLEQSKKSILSKRAKIVMNSTAPATRIFKRMLIAQGEQCQRVSKNA